MFNFIRTFKWAFFEDFDYMRQKGAITYQKALICRILVPDPLQKPKSIGLLIEVRFIWAFFMPKNIISDRPKS